MISCEHPTIILSHSLKEDVLKCRNFVTNSDEIHSVNYVEWSYSFPYDMFRAIMHRLKDKGDFDDLDKRFYCYDTRGNIYSLFLVVPCGNCLLCEARAIREWKFRALCENRYSKTPPVFITLTYKEPPLRGVEKRDVQLFLKRLRKVTGCELRFIACGEYGRKRGRPHYHLIVWNMPYFLNVTDFVDMIENCWQSGENSYNKGFVRVIPLDGKHNSKYSNKSSVDAVGYTVKYIRKQSPNKLNYPNKSFILTSRRGGIGSRYRDEMLDYYRKNPNQTTISILDPFTGDVLETNIPRYFKKLFFPTKSDIIPKNIRDLADICAFKWHYIVSAVDEYNRQLRVYRFVKGYDLIDLSKFDLTPLYKYSKYMYLPMPRKKEDIYRHFDLKELYVEIRHLIIDYESQMRLLHYYEIDKDIDIKLYSTNIQKKTVKDIAYSNTDISIAAQIDHLKLLNLYAEKREVF